MVPLKYWSNYWRALEIPHLILINVVLNLSANFVKSSNAAANQATTFAITDAKLYIPVVTLSTQDKLDLLQELKLDA